MRTAVLRILLIGFSSGVGDNSQVRVRLPRAISASTAYGKYCLG